MEFRLHQAVDFEVSGNNRSLIMESGYIVTLWRSDSGEIDVLVRFDHWFEDEVGVERRHEILFEGKSLEPVDDHRWRHKGNYHKD